MTFAVCLLLGTSVFAQDTIVVDQGLGTLETALRENGGDKVYKLTAGSWYGLESVVEVGDSVLGEGNSLTIIGEETDGMPAIIQVGVDGAGSAFPALFSVFNDLTLKNLFLTAQDFAGVTGPGVLTLNNDVKVVIDNCVIDPAGVNRTFGGGDPADGSVFYLTNSLIMNNGHMQGPNDGGWLGGMAWDTLWVENNTFVSSGQDFIGTPFHSVPNNQFVWINHNTFLWHDVWIKKSYNDQNFYFTNNLMHDISIFAQLYAWGQFFPDYKQGNTMLSLTCIDTLEIDDQGTYETLPSDRVVFWQYNNQYNSPQLRTLPQAAIDNNAGPLYLIPMLWEEDVPEYYHAGLDMVSPMDSSREARILADDVNWPYMKYNNNMYDVDPMYNNDQIAATNDSMIQNILSWYGSVIFGNGATFDGTPSYLYPVDKWAGTDPAEFPVVWPRFDGTYTNPELLTASIEKLPLGDLNWFPEQKARWMAERDQIEEHILSLNESQYTITVGMEDRSAGASIAIFPNPATDVLYIDSEIGVASASIFDVTGRLVKQVNMSGAESLQISDLVHGMYVIEAEFIGGGSYTSKFMKK